MTSWCIQSHSAYIVIFRYGILYSEYAILSLRYKPLDSIDHIIFFIEVNRISWVPIYVDLMFSRFIYFIIFVILSFLIANKSCRSNRFRIYFFLMLIIYLHIDGEYNSTMLNTKNILKFQFDLVILLEKSNLKNHIVLKIISLSYW